MCPLTVEIQGKFGFAGFNEKSQLPPNDDEIHPHFIIQDTFSSATFTKLIIPLYGGRAYHMQSAQHQCLHILV